MVKELNLQTIDNFQMLETKQGQTLLQDNVHAKPSFYQEERDFILEKILFPCADVEPELELKK